MKEPKVIYQDSQVMVINKPAGMVVNRAESVGGETLQDWVESRILRLPGSSHLARRAQDDKADLKSLSALSSEPTLEGKSDFVGRSGIVHRLDRDTSGVMVVAKTQEAFEELQRQFKERQIEKTYVALVHGKLEPGEGVMRLPVARSHKDRRKFTVGAVGKVAETGWMAKEYLQQGDETLTLVELYPKTGRTHQLRVHLKHLGHPIVADNHYLSKKRAKADAKWCPRQFLHARKLCFWWKGEKKCFEAELAADLGEVLEKLGKLT